MNQLSQMPGRESRQKLNRDVQVLRAFAVLEVMFQHRSFLIHETVTLKLDEFFQFWGGVDLFLVVSGFVISRGLLEARNRCDTHKEFLVEVLSFWIRRIWRIWPSAWFWVGVSFAMSLAIASGAVVSLAWGSLWGNALSSIAILTGLANIYAVAALQGLATQGGIPLSIYWSLSLEEQFYVILPIILLFAKGPRLAAICAVAAVVQIFWPRPIWGYMWVLRSDALLLGVIIGISLEAPWLRALLEPTFLVKPKWLRYASTFLLLFMISGMSSGHIVSFFTGIMAVLSMILVWFASYDAGYIMPEGVLKNVLVYLGARSYALYLVHLPAYLFAQDLWVRLSPPGAVIDGRFSVRLILTAAVFTLGFAEFNYQLIEQPLRRRGARLARQYKARQMAGIRIQEHGYPIVSPTAKNGIVVD